MEILKAKSPQEALQFTAQELSGMLKEATGSLKRFAAPGGMKGLTGPLGIVQVGWMGGWGAPGIAWHGSQG